MHFSANFSIKEYIPFDFNIQYIINIATITTAVLAIEKLGRDTHDSKQELAYGAGSNLITGTTAFIHQICFLCSYRESSGKL